MTDRSSVINLMLTYDLQLPQNYFLVSFSRFNALSPELLKITSITNAEGVQLFWASLRFVHPF